MEDPRLKELYAAASKRSIEDLERMVQNSQDIIDVLQRDLDFGQDVLRDPSILKDLEDRITYHSLQRDVKKFVLEAKR